MEGFLLEAVIGFVVWSVANVVYLDMVRGGLRGGRRFLAFWLGTPTTFLTMLFVKEGTQVCIEPPPDDEDALLAEVRRDRWLREGGRPLPTEASSDSNGDTP